MNQPASRHAERSSVSSRPTINLVPALPRRHRPIGAVLAWAAAGVAWVVYHMAFPDNVPVFAGSWLVLLVALGATLHAARRRRLS